ncbi:unnamed protein product, partial [Ilex paraguariensis]
EDLIKLFPIFIFLLVMAPEESSRSSPFSDVPEEDIPEIAENPKEEQQPAGDEATTDMVKVIRGDKFTSATIRGIKWLLWWSYCKSVGDQISA